MRPAPSRYPPLRPPPLRLVASAVLAVAAGLIVHHTVAAAAGQAASLGETRVVAVVQRVIEAGAELDPGAVTMVERPVAHVPEDAVADDPTGRTARAGLRRGEILLGYHLADDGRHGPSALVPDGRRGVTVPTVDATAPVATGDIVDVIASYDPASVTGAPTTVIAGDAVVVDVGDDAVTVAVTLGEVTEVAFALANGYVTLALVG